MKVIDFIIKNHEHPALTRGGYRRWLESLSGGALIDYFDSLNLKMTAEEEFEAWANPVNIQRDPACDSDLNLKILDTEKTTTTTNDANISE